MIIWLVLVVSGAEAGTESPRMMHVENFTSYQSCQATYRSRRGTKKPATCVPANKLGTQPPPY